MKLIFVAVLLAAFSGQAPRLAVAKEAHSFLATLTPEQRSRAIYAANSEQLYNWHFVPRSRPGLAWREMSATQQSAAHALLRSSLSKLGYSKIEEIRALEPILKELERGNPGRDERLYSFAFFGEPSDTKPWAWRYEGHHLSLTFAYRDGVLSASTPQFLGSNPEEHNGKRPLAKERDLAYKLLESFNRSQRAKAHISTTSPGDIITGNDRTAAIEGRRGVRFAELDETQKRLLLDLLRAHAEVQSEKEQTRRMKQVQGEELSDLVFAWMGTTERRGRHYYRIQGKNLIVEYDNSQGNGSHIHTVWRNLKEDFGADPLLHHYEHGHPH